MNDEILKQILNELQKMTSRMDAFEEKVEMRFDQVHQDITDLKRFVDRTNIASTGGDEKLLEMVRDIQDNMVTKADIRYYDLKTAELDREIFKLKHKQ